MAIYIWLPLEGLLILSILDFALQFFVLVATFTRDRLSRDHKLSWPIQFTRDFRSVLSPLKARGPERGSRSALIVVAGVFSWLPVCSRHVRGGLGRSRSLISSPPYNQLWGDYIDMLVSIEDEAARPQVKLEEQGVFFQYETAYLWW